MSKSLKIATAIVSLLLIAVITALYITFTSHEQQNPASSTASSVQPTDDTSAYPKPSDFDGNNAYVKLNNNEPNFSDEDKTIMDAFETYSELDQLGRCGVAYANICQDIMPTEERGEISSVKPSGWQSIKVDFVEGGYLYNRCHLIGFQLAGENANKQNLITGTRYLNIEGMLGFENQIAEYVESTGNHVLYRVTPIYNGGNLVADGVQMEAWSVEDNGEGIKFNVFAYNVQPGVDINYADGTAFAYLTETNITDDANKSDNDTNVIQNTEPTETYILNVNSGKFHLPDCESVGKMAESNQRRITSTKADAIAQGYEPCNACLPN